MSRKWIEALVREYPEEFDRARRNVTALLRFQGAPPSGRTAAAVTRTYIETERERTIELLEAAA